MTKKSDTIRLRHMLDATEKARSFVQGQTRKDLDRDEKLALALVRLVEVIGEAAAKVSTDVQARHGNIPWQELIATRNRLIHGYEEVDFDILWSILVDDLPALSRELRSALKEETGADQEALWK